jgi:cytochrome c-type biogenesis protein CcmH/NrfG
MKFKPLYLYLTIALAAVIILVIVASQNSDEPTGISSELSQNIPNDDVHKNLMKRGSNQPSKENVSEEYRKKMAELKAAVEKNPDDTLALKKYADFLSAAHNMNDAVIYYEKILKVDPKRADIRFALAVIYYHQQDYAKCEDENNQVLSFDPKNQMALYNLGAVAATRGEVNKAKDFWNQVIKINPESETGKLAKESLAKL